MSRFVIKYIFFIALLCMGVKRELFSSQYYGNASWEYDRVQSDNRLTRGASHSLNTLDFIHYLNKEAEKVLEQGNFMRAERVAQHIVAFLCGGSPLPIENRPPSEEEFAAITQSFFWVSRIVELTRDTRPSYHQTFQQKLFTLVNDAFRRNNVRDEKQYIHQRGYIIRSILAADKVINLKEALSWDQLSDSITASLHSLAAVSSNNGNRLFALVSGRDDILKTSIRNMSYVPENTMLEILDKVRKTYEPQKQEAITGDYYRDIANDVRYLTEQTAAGGLLCFFHAMTQTRAGAKYDPALFAQVLNNIKGQEREQAKRIISKLILSRLAAGRPSSAAFQGKELAEALAEYDRAQAFKAKFSDTPIGEIEDLMTLKMIAMGKADVLTLLAAIKNQSDRFIPSADWGNGRNILMSKIFKDAREKPGEFITKGFNLNGIEEPLRSYYSRIVNYIIKRLKTRGQLTPGQVMDEIEKETGPGVPGDISVLMTKILTDKHKEKEFIASLDIDGNEEISEREYYDLALFIIDDTIVKDVTKAYDQLTKEYDERLQALEEKMNKRIMESLDQTVTLHSTRETLLAAIMRSEVPNMPLQNVPSNSNLSGLFAALNKKNTVTFHEQGGFGRQSAEEYRTGPSNPYRFLYLSNGHYTRLKPLDKDGKPLLSDLS